MVGGGGNMELAHLIGFLAGFVAGVISAVGISFAFKISYEREGATLQNIKAGGDVVGRDKTTSQ